MNFNIILQIFITLIDFDYQIMLNRIRSYEISCECLGGYNGWGTPVPISNTEVKSTCADGSASRRCARVGSRQDIHMKIHSVSKSNLQLTFARVAQLEEQRPSKAKVTGSSPVSCTIFPPRVISSVGESICLTSRGS